MKIILFASLFFHFNFCYSQIVKEKLDSPMTENCMTEIEKAKKDFDIGKYTYCFYKRITNTRGIEILEKKLKTFAIERVFEIPARSTVEIDSPIDKKDKNCYREFMQYLLEKKFGKTFFDKLIKESDSLYVINHNDEIYGYADFNTQLVYKKATTIETQFEDIVNDFIKTFYYPKNFKYKNENEYSNTSANFVINKDGSVSNLVITTTFQNKENYKYKGYFEKRLKSFILKSKWKPGILYGVPVRTGFSFGITYK